MIENYLLESKTCNLVLFLAVQPKILFLLHLMIVIYSKIFRLHEREMFFVSFSTQPRIAVQWAFVWERDKLFESLCV